MIKVVPVIIVTYNNEETIDMCLTSLLRTKLEGMEMKVIIADNSSKDSTRERILKYKGKVSEIILLDRNYGYPGAIIRALNSIEGKHYKYFVLLNPDTIVTENWLSELLSVMEEDPKIGVAQSLLLSMDGSIDSAGGFVNLLGYPIELFKGKRLTFEKRLARYVEIGYAKGAASIFRRETYVRAGGFDERFFFYYDETDLCYRIRRLGYKVVLVPRSIVYHKGLGSKVPFKELFVLYYMERNRLLFLYKNMPYCLLPGLLWSLVGALKSSKLYRRIRLKALLDFVRLAMGCQLKEPLHLEPKSLAKE
ncbi:glycosyltransferase family 2 protein [Thermofilum sp.]|uniref:glycosyltransferase family 2 protein n=1 Tax=Thermofilum sp. TaxID=1961369 RepID=UPI003169BCAF